MVRLALRLCTAALLAAAASCSDLGEDPCANAGCSVGVADPLPVTGPIDLGCIAAAGLDAATYVFTWDLFVDPGPIVANQSFAVDLSGVVRVSESANDDVNDAFGGFKRGHVADLKATVLVKEGVTDMAERTVVLRPKPGNETCAYDEDGKSGPHAGPEFPPCSPANDIGDGGNTDCLGLGNRPDRRNPCGLFAGPETSEDEDVCRARGKADQWSLNGFCVTSDSEVQLETKLVAFTAAPSGNVVFGWDDENTSATLDTTRPTDPVWTLVAPEPSNPGPNSLHTKMRFDIEQGPIEAHVECTMARGTPSVLRPVDPADLISFRIQEP